MSRAPFFKLFFSDLAGDTLSLSADEFGSYMLLLGAMWNGGGSLPADPNRLARIARCSPKTWPRKWAVLRDFFTEEDGVIRNGRLTDERQKVDSIRAERTTAGKLGAEAKRLKKLNGGKANGSAKDKQPEPEPEIPSGRASETPDARAWREAVDLLTASGRMREGAARAFFGKLLRDHGLEPYRLLPTITAADLKGTQDPQGYLAAAAKRLGSPASSPSTPAANVSEWTPDVWAIAVERFYDTGAWDDASMGPRPGSPGCRAPASLLREAA